MKYRFQDNTLPFEERAKDLLSRLTREEKVGMITSQLDDIPRLGIKKTHIGTEIARGVVNRDQKRETTILPQPWGMAAMFDDALMERLGDMAGDETRITHDMEERPSSLELFGPTIDMERDPRWGRNEEAYGEDPCLTGKMSAAYCRGLTGKDEKYLKTAPLLKHFYANNYENERQTTNANITPRLKHEYYLKAFEPAVREGRAPGLMTAYNCINGVEGVNNPDVSEICKKEWGMTFAVSDGGDFGQNVAAHRTYENHAQSMGDILGVGADMMLDSRSMVDPAVREALEKGYLTEENLDKAVYSTLLLRFKLGDFDEDHPYAHIDPAKLASPAHKALAVKAAKESVILLENRGMLPLTDDGKCTVAVVGPLANENYTCWYCGYAPNQTPVVKGFREKLGEDRVLFDEGFDRVRIRSEKTGKYLRIAENGAVYADADENTADLFERADWDFGAWTLRSVRTGKYLTEGKNFFDETPQDENAVTIDPGMNCTADVVFGWFVKELLYAKEEDGVLYLDTWQHRAVAVNDENKLVAKAGSGDCPCKQFTLEVVSSGAERVAELAQRADHVIVCAGNQPLINAREEYDRPDIRLPKAQTALLNAAAAANESTLLYLVTGYPFAINKEKDTAKAVLCSTHLGPCLGHVAAATVFGENNPAGRTPTTWYRSVRDLPALDDYDIAKNHVTYLYFRGKPLYAFGYGLSYTTFAYSNLTVKQENGEVIATVNVQNTGALDGDEVVQLYMSLPDSLRVRPIHALKAFKRVHIQAGETVTVTLNFKIDDLAVWCNGRKIYTVESGVYKMEIGAASDDIRLTASVEIAGEAFPGRPGFFKQEAIDADDYSGVTFLTDKRDGETYVEAKDFRSFLVYKNMDLTGCNAFECAMSAPSGDVEILLADNKTGKVLGKAGGTGTGSLTKFTSFTCDVAAEAGLTELRIVFTKQTSLKWFRFYTV
ncbi:glycoside hydrolase family 3 C-terminal domain-containing protein [Hominenteromicrobium sp.]|jgi:beta-glucosidase-related glycosidases|uniref:glycoside hydrolase family 3 C-terminal domain-containing protein n=1 Tax=Hominenteromicrobium sp. TaxID=3073581 RepID=UPI003AB56173